MRPKKASLLALALVVKQFYVSTSVYTSRDKITLPKHLEVESHRTLVGGWATCVPIIDESDREVNN
jgi:hypothetical protein